jgi:hypothetical protein
MFLSAPALAHTQTFLETSGLLFFSTDSFIRYLEN